MTTKRNKTITAPTYTSTKAIAKNSACKRSQIPAALKNARTRDSAAVTGFLEVMTLNPEARRTKDKT